MEENTVKRRDFLKTSVGAGVALSIVPYGALSPLKAQTARGKTLYDKVFDAHIVADLGGRTALLHRNLSTTMGH